MVAASDQGTVTSTVNGVPEALNEELGVAQSTVNRMIDEVQVTSEPSAIT